MKKHILIVGERQVGKSTLVAKLIENIDRPIYGFMTKTKSDDERGFHEIRMYPADGSAMNDTAQNLIGISNGKGKREIYPETFENLGVSLLGAKPNGVIVMDELGFMEEEAEQFKARVLELFDGDIPIIATTKASHRPSAFLDTLKAHPNAEIFNINEENRDELYSLLLNIYEKNS